MAQQGGGFDYNDDFPPETRQPRNPGQFPRPIIDQCERYRDRVRLRDGQIQLFANIIVPLIVSPSASGAGATGSTGRTTRMRSSRGFDDGIDDDDSACSYSDDDHYSSDDDEDMTDVVDSRQPRMANHAYLLVRTLREAIYGHVWSGIVLRRGTQTITEGGVERTRQIWEATDQRCAVKEMGLHQIMEERGSAENPYQEVSAMQYLQRYHHAAVRNNLNVDMGRMDLGGDGDGAGRANDTENEFFRNRAQETMLDTHVMMPLDVLTDNQHLYCVMPYCDGGELFDVLERRQKFPEEEARYWFMQVLDGVETLQKAGICHRDMSLENLLTDRTGRALIIDMGMSLKIPYLEDDWDRANANTGNTNNGPPVDHRTRQRCLIKPSHRCGKPYYMSNEVFEGRIFDGHAVDVWALGPLLFLMVCGFPPWDQASMQDQRFHTFSSGYFMQTAESWNLGLSADLVDLLQRMFFRDPRTRLSLNQVRNHPWMNGPVAPPPHL